MIRGLLLVAVAVWLLAVTVGDVRAKTPEYIVSGGELGMYAARLSGVSAAGAVYFPVWLPGPDAVESARPKSLPAPAYDIYMVAPPEETSARRAVAVPPRKPDWRYYRQAGLLHALRSNVWTALSAETAALLDGAIDRALERTARDGLAGLSAAVGTAGAGFDHAAAPPVEPAPAARGRNADVAAAAGVGLAVALVALSGGLAALRRAQERRRGNDLIRG